MTRFRALPLLLFAAALPALARAAEDEQAKDPRRGVPAWTAAQRRALASGEIVLDTTRGPGTLGGQGYAAVLIDQPPARVWAVINDYDRFAEFMPNVDASRAARRYGATVIHECTVSLLGFDFQYTNRCVADLAHWRIDWTYVTGSIADNRGFWFLDPLDQDRRTVLIYSVVLDVGRLLPEFLQDFATRRSLPGVAKAVRERAKDDRYEALARAVEAERRALLAAREPAVPQPPEIARLSRAAAAPGERVVVFGHRFLHEGKPGALTLAGGAVPVESLRETLIVFAVPADAASGPLVVTTAAGASAPVTFTVTPPEGGRAEGPAGARHPARQKAEGGRQKAENARKAGVARLTSDFRLPTSDFGIRPASPAYLALWLVVPPLPADADGNGVPDRFEAGLARKFAPCMAFAGPDLWPVDIAYLWSEGAPLMVRATHADGRTADRQVLPADQLGTRPWAHLPDDNGREGAERLTFAYYVDGPGEATGPGPDDETWTAAWRRIQGDFADDPRKARFPPRVFAHFFWKDRDAGELAIQYWFYYPFDKWINNHEGDVEHVNVLLRVAGEDAARFDPAQDRQTIIGAVYHFHGKIIRRTGEELILVGPRKAAGDAASAGPGRHPMVYVGGKGSDVLPLSAETWGGLYSGGSYPYPANFRGAGAWITNHDDTRTPARMLHAEEIEIVVLPEPDQVDYAARPDRSWFKLNFYPGAPETPANHPLVKVRGTGAPVQPGRKDSWNRWLAERRFEYRIERAEPAPFRAPAGWAVRQVPALLPKAE